MEKNETKANVVKKTSEAYGYKYTSLGDMATQGIAIPKMSTMTDYQTMKDYVAYWDEDLKEWIRGAEIVIPENIFTKDGKAKMNASQLYGSALTYARRYTTSLCRGLADVEDKNLEAGEGETIQEKPKATKEQVDLLLQNASPSWVSNVTTQLKLKSIYDMTMEDADRFIKKMNQRKANG